MFLEGYDYRRQLYDRTAEAWHSVLFTDSRYSLHEERDLGIQILLGSLGLAFVEEKVLDGFTQAGLSGGAIVTEIIEILALASAEAGRDHISGRLLGLATAVRAALQVKTDPGPAYHIALQILEQRLPDHILAVEMAEGKKML